MHHGLDLTSKTRKRHSHLPNEQARFEADAIVHAFVEVLLDGSVENQRL